MSKAKIKISAAFKAQANKAITSTDHMKTSLLSLVIFVSFCSVKVSAQEFKKQFDAEFCSCIEKYEEYSDETFSSCVDETLPKFQHDIEKEYLSKVKANDYEKGYEELFLQDFMVRLIGSCDSFYNHMDQLNREGIENFKIEYKKMSLDSLKTAFETSKEITDYWQIANWKFANGDISEAERMYLEMLKNEPENTQALQLIALLYNEKKEFEKAKSYYDKLYELTKDMTFKVYSEMDRRKIQK